MKLAREQRRKQAKVHVVRRHLVDDALDRLAFELRQPGEMLFSQAKNRGSIQFGYALKRQTGTAEYGGDRLKRRWARRSSPAPWTHEWLESTCSIRVVPERYAEHKHRPARVQPETGSPAKELSAKGRHKAVREIVGGGWVICPPAPCQL